MKSIAELDFTKFVFAFGDVYTKYTDFCAQRARNSGGKFFAFYDGERAAGYSISVPDGGARLILHAFTRPEYRRKGVFTGLLSYVVKTADAPVRITLTESNEFYPFLSNAVLKAGFKQVSGSVTYRCSGERFDKWDEFMSAKGNRLAGRVKRWGFECVSFAEADKKLLDDIRNSSDNYFGNRLSAREFFDATERGTDMALSFAAVRDGRAAAYCLVTRPDESSAVFEQVSAAEGYMRKGVVFLPFAASVNACEKAGIKRGAFTVYSDNNSANAFRKKAADILVISGSRAWNYISEAHEKA